MYSQNTYKNRYSYSYKKTPTPTTKTTPVYKNDEASVGYD